MPELPEVETVARDLRAEAAGRTVVEVVLVNPLVLRHPSPAAFTEALRGAGIEAVDRRGKFILCALSTGDDLVLHLGMTGHIGIVDAATPVRPHTHVRLLLDDARELRFTDPRRFGRVALGDRATLTSLRVLPVLGIEPLSPEFTAAALDAVLRTTTRTVKAALLDQRGVAGLGNIYVDEACHRAGVRPGRRCHRLTRAERAALHRAVVEVLEEALRNRGTTFDDYRDLFDSAGGNAPALRVYGRAGQPCLRCGTPLRRTVLAGRGTAYCPSCQR